MLRPCRGIPAYIQDKQIIASKFGEFQYFPYLCPQKDKVMITTIPSQTSEISTVDALWVLIQGQTKAVRKALTKRLLAEQDKTKVQKAMVKESLTRAFDELHAGKVHHDARKLFKK